MCSEASAPTKNSKSAEVTGGGRGYRLHRSTEGQMGEGAVYVIARDGDVKRTMANEEGVVEGALGSVEMWSVGLAQTEGENMGMASLSHTHFL